MRRQRQRRGLSAAYAAGSLAVLMVLWGMGQATTAAAPPAPVDAVADAVQTGSAAQAAGLAPVMVAGAMQGVKEEIVPEVTVDVQENENEGEEEDREEEAENDDEVYVEEDDIRAPLPSKAAPPTAKIRGKLRQLEEPAAVVAAPAADDAPSPRKETRELPWETEAWQRDLDELQTLLDMDIEPEALKAEGSSLAADIGSDGHVETMGAFGNLMNFLSPSPDPAWPFCSPGGVLYKVGLVCPVMGIAAKILMRSPPDFEKLTTEHHCPNPRGELPGHLEELSEKEDGTPVPMMIPKELVERERPTYAWFLTHIYNM